MSWYKFTFSPMDVEFKPLKLLNMFHIAYLQSGSPKGMTLYVDVTSKHTHIYYLTPSGMENTYQWISDLMGESCPEPSKENLFPIMGDTGAPRPLDRPVR